MKMIVGACEVGFFSVSEEIFHLLFSIFCNSIYVPQFRGEDLVYNSLFTSQRNFCSVPDMDSVYYACFVSIKVI